MADLNITWADVTGLAPELATLPAASQTTVLTHVKAQVSVAHYGSEAKALIVGTYLAAHLGTIIAKKLGSTAPLQSVSAGGVSKTFAVSVASDSTSLQTTTYGKEYQRLARVWGRRFAAT